MSASGIAGPVGAGSRAVVFTSQRTARDGEGHAQTSDEREHGFVSP